MRKGKTQIAGCDLRNEFALMRIAGAMPQQAAAKYDGREIRLQHEAAPKRLHDDHRFDRAAAETAVFLGKRNREQTQFGKLLPVLACVTGVVLGECLALFEVVAIGDEAIDALLQE